MTNAWQKARFNKVLHYRHRVGILWGRVESVSGTHHWPWIMEGHLSCDCEAAYYGSMPCSHLISLIAAVPQDRLEGLNVRPDSGYLQTTLVPWNDLVGGLPVGSMLGLFGPGSAGKTILSMQMAHEVIRATGQNALIIDTEGSGPTHSEWNPSFNKRFGHDVQLVRLTLSKDAKTGKTTVAPLLKLEGKQPRLFVADIRNIEKLLDFHGRPVVLGMSDKGKLSLKPRPDGWQDDIWETPVGHWVAKNDVKCLVYDSVTNPLAVFGTERENFPARATATNFLMLQAQQLCQELSLVAIDVMHETIDPANPYSKPGASGGSAIMYNHKYLAYLEKGKSARTPKMPGRDEIKDDENKHTLRSLFIARHPSRQPWVRGAAVDLTSRGFVAPGQADVSKQVKA